MSLAAIQPHSDAKHNTKFVFKRYRIGCFMASCIQYLWHSIPQIDYVADF